MTNTDPPSWMPPELFEKRPNNRKVREQILAAYESANNVKLSQPPTTSEIDAISKWINSNYEAFSDFFLRPHKSKKVVYSPSLSAKISSLAQHHCSMCTIHEGGLPIHVMTIRIPPISKQAAASKKGRRAAFERAIKSRFDGKQTPYPEHVSICLLIVFVVKKTGAQKDLDNMAKALLDAIKNVLFGDDRRIDHLNIIRIKSPDEEFVYLNLRETRLNDHEDVLFPQMLHSWGGAQALNLEDFMEDSDTPEI